MSMEHFKNFKCSINHAVSDIIQFLVLASSYALMLALIKLNCTHKLFVNLITYIIHIIAPGTLTLFKILC
uniref:Uncharacterized protein n=1 Tax=Anguilla anguilla TaxID=7936 RepID=A0A0E9VWY1_ANGAN